MTMNNQLYEKKCDCKPYTEIDNDDDGSHRATLIKMELPAEYEDCGLHYRGTNQRQYSSAIGATIRFVSYLLIILLLGYALWRIREIELAMSTSERYGNVTLLLESNNLHRQLQHEQQQQQHVRIARSAEANLLLSPDAADKQLPRGGLLTAKNEADGGGKKFKPITTKDEFVSQLMQLFDRIQAMHNDTDRSHFDNNMKSVFQAWLPVFDALLPRDLIDPANPNLPRAKRSATDEVKSSEESFEEREKKRQVVRIARSVDDKSSEDKQNKKSSEESSEEKTKNKKNQPSRSRRSVERESSEEVTTNDDQREAGSVENKNGSGESASSEEEIKDTNVEATSEATARDIGEESLEEEVEVEEHSRKSRSADSDESPESIEKKLRKMALDDRRYVDLYSKTRAKPFLPAKAKSSEESSSSESMEKLKRKYSKKYDAKYGNDKYVYVLAGNQ